LLSRRGGGCSLSSPVPEEVTSVRRGLGERDITLDKTPILEQTSPPRYFCQENLLANSSLLVKSTHGEEEDSDRRRKDSLEDEPWGSACNKVPSKKSTVEASPSPLSSVCQRVGSVHLQSTVQDPPFLSPSACNVVSVGPSQHVNSTPHGQVEQISGLGLDGVPLGRILTNNALSSSLDIIKRFCTP